MAAPPWTNAWNEASPSDSDAANTLGSNGRQLRFDIRQRLDWQHVWNQNTNDDGGHRNIVIASAYHTANQESFKSSGFSLTGANTQSVLDLAGTWNTSGLPTGIKLNILDSNSAAASLLMDLQVGGSSKFKVDKAGNVTATSFSGSTASGVVQTVQTTTTSTTDVTTITSYVNITGLSRAITPTSASNRVRIQATMCIQAFYVSGAATLVNVQVTRGNGGPTVQEFVSVIGSTIAGSTIASVAIDCIDSPATTSSTTYFVQIKITSGSQAHVNNSGTSTITATEIV